MHDKSTVQHIRESVEQWEPTDVQRAQSRLPERRDPFTTISGAAVERLYTPADVAQLDYERDLGVPDRYQFTRGIHPTGYRGKPWTMRRFAGFGTAEETNARFKYLLSQGQAGLSIAFDMPTVYGGVVELVFRGACDVALDGADEDRGVRFPDRTRVAL